MVLVRAVLMKVGRALTRLHENEGKGPRPASTMVNLNLAACFALPMSRCGLAVRRLAGKQKDLGSNRFGSPFSSKIVVHGHCLVTLPTQLIKR